MGYSLDFGLERATLICLFCYEVKLILWYALLTTRRAVLSGLVAPSNIDYSRELLRLWLSSYDHDLVAVQLHHPSSVEGHWQLSSFTLYPGDAVNVKSTDKSCSTALLWI